MTTTAAPATARTLEEIAALLDGAERIALSAHIRPDGDAIGSQLGLALPLEAAGKEVVLLGMDGCPDNLRFLPGADRVTVPDGSPIEADLVVALDTAARDRLGEGVVRAFESAGCPWVNIDHHVSNPGYGDHVHIDPTAPATGQIVHDLVLAGGWPRPVEALENLFVAISTDTGSFQYPSTTAHTFRTAAAMVDEGVDVGRLSEMTYHRRPLRKVKLLRHLFGRMEIRADGKVAWWDLDMATRDRLGLLPEDSEDLINELRAIDTVVAAVFFEELPDGKVRVSSRSKDPAVDVCAICRLFGGGGHPLAAGARLSGPLSEARRRFLEQINEALPPT